MAAPHDTMRPMNSSLSAQRIVGAPQPTQGGSTYVDPETLPSVPSQFDRIAMKVSTRRLKAPRGFVAHSGDA